MGNPPHPGVAPLTPPRVGRGWPRPRGLRKRSFEDREKHCGQELLNVHHWSKRGFFSECSLTFGDGCLYPSSSPGEGSFVSSETGDLCGRPCVAPWTALVTLTDAAREPGGSHADSATVRIDLNAGRAVGRCGHPVCVYGGAVP